MLLTMLLERTWRHHFDEVYLLLSLLERDRILVDACLWDLANAEHHTLNVRQERHHEQLVVLLVLAGLQVVGEVEVEISTILRW